MPAISHSGNASSSLTIPILLVLTTLVLLALRGNFNFTFGSSGAATTTATTVTTGIVAASAEAEAIATALTTTGTVTFALIQSYILAYNPPPTTDGLNEALERLSEKINNFTKKDWIKVVKHKCPGRTSWGLLAGQKKPKEALHFEWDSFHPPGEIEVYTSGSKKVHLGSISFGDQPNKPAIKKRIATCTCN